MAYHVTQTTAEETTEFGFLFLEDIELSLLTR